MAEMQINPDLAKRLFFEGATVVILNMPEGTEFGIDYNTWHVGPRFRGVKMIPPGIHFFHYSSVNRCNTKETGPRTGFFLSLQQRDLQILHWNSSNEEVDLTPASEQEIEIMRSNLQEMDKFLGPYPYETLKKWISLTNFISEPVMKKLQPESGQICAFSEVLPVLAGKHTKDRAEQNLPPYDTECKSYAEGLARLPKMKLKAGTEIRFTEMPKQMYPDGATPEEITRHSMDLSYALETVINKRYSSQPQDVLAELQFAFICFLIGNVYDAFEHWKKLLNVLCRSEDAIGKHRVLYTNLISVLYHQLSEIPADFFVDIVSQDNFLTSTLQAVTQWEFRDDCPECRKVCIDAEAATAKLYNPAQQDLKDVLINCSSTVDRTLRKKAEKFKAHLTKKFKWDFEAEPDDCAPVVVELPEGVLLD